LDPSQPSRTNPKPDLYFGFPVHNAEDQKFAGFRNDPSLQNFTVDTLSQLAMKGLRSIPVSSSLTNVAEMKRDRTELQFPLLCFPWCVIQLKGIEKAAAVKENNDSVLETSCQASIAASGALAMLEKLARFADVKQDGQHIPPVITITSVGPNITVWLAFSDIIDDQYRDHVRNLISVFSSRKSDNLIEDAEYLERLYQQDLGCHSILSYYRQPFFLVAAYSEAQGVALHRSMEAPLLS
jgi:hypothetical protein